MRDEWGDLPPTFSEGVANEWGAAGAFVEEEEEHRTQELELIGSQLWVSGQVDLGRFRRVSDYVNLLEGYLLMRDAVILTHEGAATRMAIPEYRVRPDDIAIVGQQSADPTPAPTAPGVFIEKAPRRLVVLTRAHIIDGSVFIHGDGSVMAFVESSDPKFIPMSDVKVRWLTDRRVAARYPFALVQRSQILGVATEGITLGSADMASRRSAAAIQAAATADELAGEPTPSETNGA
jgi:hypothetical protein